MKSGLFQLFNTDMLTNTATIEKMTTHLLLHQLFPCHSAEVNRANFAQFPPSQVQLIIFVTPLQTLSFMWVKL